MLGSLAIVFGALGAILMLQRYSAREYQTAVETDELALKSYEFFISGWRAAIGAQPAGPWMPPEVAEEERRLSMQAFSDAYRRYQLEADEGQDSSVRAQIEELSALVTQAYNHLVAGRNDQAVAAMGETNPYYYALTDAVADASAQYGQTARQGRDVAMIATTLVGLGAFLLIATLYWRYRKAQLRHERAVLDSEVLRRSESRFRPLVQSSSDLIAVVENDGVLKYASETIEEFTGFAQSEALGRSIFELVSEDDRRLFLSQLKDTAARENYKASFEVELPARDGAKPRVVQVGCTNFLENPDIKGLVVNMRDITERKALEEQLRHQAFHDSLTGLSNRARFIDRLEHALQIRKPSKDFCSAVLFMDLDFFKNVNDDMGHQVGDDLLKQVAERIERCVRSGDTSARLGGDEFAILLEEPRSGSEAEAVAERILAEMKRPFDIGGVQAHISASIGIVRISDERLTAEEVMRNADIAMYDAKENGRGRIQVFVKDMQISLAERLRLMREIEQAVERQEFVVYYQPTFDLATESITGFEALVRWNHPERGLIPPSGFVSVAEETGAILGIGRLVLRDACRQAREWQENFPEHPDFSISVNISTKQILRAGFIESVREALDESGLDPHSLILEITEGTLLPNPDYVIDALGRLRAMGVRVAIDDFGTGFSSLNYLKRFPIDILKVDRSFVEGVDRSDKDRLLIQTVMDLGHALNLSIVAEGIERREQLALLKRLNCTVGQGYLFARPLDASSAGHLLGEQPRNLKESPPAGGGKAA